MLSGVERSVKRLRSEISDLEQEIERKRADIERLVGLEEATLRAIAELASAMKELKKVDGESVAEIEEAVLRMFDGEDEDKSVKQNRQEKRAESAEHKGEENAVRKESRNLEELTSRLSYDNVTKTLFVKCRSSELAEQWERWFRDEIGGEGSSVERINASLVAKEVPRSKALEFLPLSFDFPPAERGEKEESSGNVKECISVGDIVQNGMGIEFTVTRIDGEIVELLDSKRKTVRYPASVLSVVQDKKAS